MPNLKRTTALGLCLLWIAMAMFGVAFDRSAQAASVTQGYHSDSNIPLGAIVSTTSSGGNDLQLTNLQSESLMVGVVVDSKSAIIDLQPSGTDLRVALNGDVSILVTNLTGNINKGDNLVISPLSGIATKDTADSTATKYIAVATQSFSSSSAGSHTVSITLNDGKQEQVAVGIIQAELNIGDRPSSIQKNSNNILASLGSKIAGKPIDTAQLFAATAVFITTFSVAGLLLQGSIRGSFVALGRNPLSKPLIVNNLLKVMAMGLLVLIAGTAMAYTILVV